MIVTTDRGKNVISVDRVFTKTYFPHYIILKKELPTIDDRIKTDGVLFETDLVSGAFGTYVGYAIAANSNGSCKLLSASGSITNGGTIFVTDHFVAIAYNNTSGFNVVLQNEGTEYEPLTIKQCDPTINFVTASSVLLGNKPTAYTVIGDRLFEAYDNDITFLGFPAFERGVIRNGRLIGAFGISTGTWGCDIEPRNTIAARKSLLNRWRLTPRNKTFSEDEGIWTANNESDLVVNALRNGDSVLQYSNRVGVYALPSSGSFGTPGLVHFVVLASDTSIERHWDTVSGLAVGGLTGVDSVLSQLVRARSEDDLKAVFATGGGLVVDSGVLASILQEYEALYQKLLDDQLAQSYEALQSTCQEIVATLVRFCSEGLDISHLLSDLSGLNSKVVSALAHNVLEFTSYPSLAVKHFKDTEEFLFHATKLLRDCKWWIEAIAVPAQENEPPKLATRLKSKTTTADGVTQGYDLFETIHTSAQNQARAIYDRVGTVMNALYEASAKSGNFDQSNIGGEFFYTDTWQSWGPVVWHTHKTKHYRYLGCDVGGDINDVVNTLLNRGWFLRADGALTFGDRTDVMKQNTQLLSVRVERANDGKHKTRIVMRVSTYYIGAVFRELDVNASVRYVNESLVNNAVSKASGSVGFASKSVTYVGVSGVYAADGTYVSNPNPWHARTEIPVDGCDTKSGYCSLKVCGHPHSNLAFLTGSYCRAETGGHYRDALKAAPTVVFDIEMLFVDDLVTVDMPQHPSGESQGDVRAIQTHAKNMLAYANEQSIIWLLSALESEGFFDTDTGVKLCGRSGNDIISQECLAYFTSFTLNDSAKIVEAINKIIEGKSAGPKTDRDGNIVRDEKGQPVHDTVKDSGVANASAKIAKLEVLRDEFDKLARDSQSKAWFLGNFSPLFIREDWELLGWYLKV